VVGVRAGLAILPFALAAAREIKIDPEGPDGSDRGTVAACATCCWRWHKLQV